MIRRLPRITATWRDRMAVGTNSQADLAHLLAKTRHFLVGHRQRGFGRDVAQAPGRCHRWSSTSAQPAFDQLDQGCADRCLVVGNQPRLERQRVVAARLAANPCRAGRPLSS